MGKTWIDSAHLAPVCEMAHPPSLSPALLEELWCCCKAATSGQFEAVMAK